ncbi:MAG TPA: neutral zinc metallopeptidase [Gemmatimonadaceae bacterium]|nr:neutral zinc metallopeptidase [Gemmatimonadaceae bacterium]
MRLGRRSKNIEDRRGMRAGPVVGGIGGIVLLIAALALGVDPRQLLEQAPQSATVSPEDSAALANDPGRIFVSQVLADTEDTWNELFRAAGSSYEEPRLVLFRDATPSACGTGQSAMGPFYCPLDNRVYIDLSFFEELRSRFGAAGDFAQAYVIAHEVGHHVQNLTGTLERTASLRQRLSQTESNRLSVMQELQADCYAGVWANHGHRSRQILEEGDIEEGLRAAAAIGDDRLQRESQGRVVPDAFTHGTSTQRVRWFRRGLETGDASACDTFNASSL